MVSGWVAHPIWVMFLLTSTKSYLSLSEDFLAQPTGGSTSSLMPAGVEKWKQLIPVVARLSQTQAERNTQNTWVLTPIHPLHSFSWRSLEVISHLIEMVRTHALAKMDQWTPPPLFDELVPNGCTKSLPWITFPCVLQHLSVPTLNPPQNTFPNCLLRPLRALCDRQDSPIRSRYFDGAQSADSYFVGLTRALMHHRLKRPVLGSAGHFNRPRLRVLLSISSREHVKKTSVI